MRFIQTVKNKITESSDLFIKILHVSSYIYICIYTNTDLWAVPMEREARDREDKDSEEWKPKVGGGSCRNIMPNALQKY